MAATSESLAATTNELEASSRKQGEYQLRNEALMGQLAQVGQGRRGDVGGGGWGACWVLGSTWRACALRRPLCVVPSAV